MFGKCLTHTLFIVLGIALIGGLLFGTELWSYATSSIRGMQAAAKDSVPLEFELARAQDMLDEIFPEMHANIKLIAQEEVEIAALKMQVQDSRQALTQQEQQLGRLRQQMDQQFAAATPQDQDDRRTQLTSELARRFDKVQQSQILLESQQRLLAAREKSLQAAMQLLERTQARKQVLADKIKTLESQHLMLKADAVGSRVQFDDSKLAQTEKLINRIKKRLDVAERVLIHENRYLPAGQEFEPAPDEGDLLNEIDAYLNRHETAAAAVDQSERI